MPSATCNSMKTQGTAIFTAPWWWGGFTIGPVCGCEKRWRTLSGWITSKAGMEEKDGCWTKNRDGKSPQIIHLFIGFSIINHPFWGVYPYFWKHPYVHFLLGKFLCALWRCRCSWDIFWGGWMFFSWKLMENARMCFCNPLTPPKTNMEPENGPLEKEIPIGNHHFQVPC